jgi:hypothetical protein
MNLYEASTRLKYAAIGVKKTRDVNRLARAHRGKMSAFFRKQRGMVLDALQEKQYLFTESYHRLAETQYTLNDFGLLWDDIASETELELQVIITQMEAGALTKGASVAESMFVPGKGGSFDLMNPRAVNFFLEHGGSIDYIRDLQKTTGNQLKTIIADSLKNQRTYGETAKTISTKFTQFSRQRAQLIAVTETGNSYEAGNRALIDSVSDAGVQMEKSWANSQDDKVSDGCLENSAAGWIPLNAPFPSGHQQPLRFPGCRCYCLFREIQP